LPFANLAKLKEEATNLFLMACLYMFGLRGSIEQIYTFLNLGNDEDKKSQRVSVTLVLFHSGMLRNIKVFETKSGFTKISWRT
jgi:hypothetical protein